MSESSDERNDGMSPVRYAVVRGGTAAQVEAYLPAYYQVIGEMDGDRSDPVQAAAEDLYLATLPPEGVIIGGWDHAGWTLDDYVIPRLASGLYFARELREVTP